jgi:hypothetical protein
MGVYLVIGPASYLLLVGGGGYMLYFDSYRASVYFDYSELLVLIVC